MRAYANLHGFETVFDDDPYVEVGGGDGNESSAKRGKVTVGRVERRMEKAREATATPVQTVEPGKRRFR